MTKPRKLKQKSLQMKISCLFNTLFLVIAILFANSSFSQNNSSPVEKNLPDNSVTNIVKTISDNAPDGIKNLGDINSSTLLNQSKNDLVNTLLGNKTTSLMFDDQDLGSINKAIDALKNKKTLSLNEKDPAEQEIEQAQEDARNGKYNIHLKSIMYFNQSSWVIWISDKKITSQSNNKKNSLYIESVARNSVRFFLKISISKWKIIAGDNAEKFNFKTNGKNEVEIHFELKPNQTFVVGKNKIIEGKVGLTILDKNKKDKETTAPMPSSDNKTIKTDSNNQTNTSPTQNQSSSLLTETNLQ